MLKQRNCSLPARFNGKVVGTTIPDHLNAYLTLLSIEKEMSKSAMIAEALYEWRNMRNRKEIIEVIRSVTKMLQAEWIIKRIQTDLMNPKMTHTVYKIFKRDVKELLIKKGVLEHQVQMILSNLHYDNATN